MSAVSIETLLKFLNKQSTLLPETSFLRGQENNLFGNEYKKLATKDVEACSNIVSLVKKLVDVELMHLKSEVAYREEKAKILECFERDYQHAFGFDEEIRKRLKAGDIDFLREAAPPPITEKACDESKPIVHPGETVNNHKVTSATSSITEERIIQASTAEQKVHSGKIEAKTVEMAPLKSTTTNCSVGYSALTGSVNEVKQPQFSSDFAMRLLADAEAERNRRACPTPLQGRSSIARNFVAGLSSARKMYGSSNAPSLFSGRLSPIKSEHNFEDSNDSHSVLNRCIVTPATSGTNSRILDGSISDIGSSIQMKRMLGISSPDRPISQPNFDDSEFAELEAQMDSGVVEESSKRPTVGLSSRMVESTPQRGETVLRPVENSFVLKPPTFSSDFAKRMNMNK